MKLIFSLSFMLALAGCAIDGDISNSSSLKYMERESSQKELNERLIASIFIGDIEGIRRALKDGADVNGEDKSLLSFAAMRGSAEMVKLMLDHGADIESKIFGRTALMWAAERGDTDIVILLLDNGANIEAKDDVMGWTALWLAVKHNKTKTAELLIRRGANVNIQEKFKGSTPLMIAATEGYEELVKFLILKKADLNLADKQNITALMVAPLGGSVEIVNLLLRNGARINEKSKEGETVLDIVEFIQKEKKRFKINPKKLQEIKKVLLAHGAKLGAEIN